LEINTGLASLTMDDIDESGLTILICFGTRGFVEGVGVTKRIEFDVNKRITRGVIS